MLRSIIRARLKPKPVIMLGNYRAYFNPVRRIDKHDCPGCPQFAGCELEKKSNYLGARW